jgi:DNA-directed RNA polymerase specialized sigma24 family protein
MKAARDEGYDEFFAAVIGQAVRVAERVLHDRPAAEDAAVEALARAHLRWGSLRDEPHRGGSSTATCS